MCNPCRFDIIDNDDIVTMAVGPVWHDGRSNEKKLLAMAVYNSLLKANEMQLESISIPAISSGIFGFPKDLCAEIMVFIVKKLVLIICSSRWLFNL
jgi:putative ATPase